LARGELLRTAVKREKAVTRARIETEYKVTNRLKGSLDGIAVSARDHIGRLIDNIQLDPLECIAVAGTTILTKQQILPMIANVLGIEIEEIHNEALVWLVSIAASYIIVHNFGMLLNAGADIAGNVTDIIKWLIIGKAVGIPAGAAGAVSPWSVPMGLTDLIGTVTLVPYPVPTYTPEEFEKKFGSKVKFAIGF
jgi:hypothetical protein